jgi:hypothetical protein
MNQAFTSQYRRNRRLALGWIFHERHPGMTAFLKPNRFRRLFQIDPLRLKTARYRITVVDMILKKRKAVRLTQEVKAAG